MNTNLNPVSIYLAGPIDDILEAEARDWRATISAPMNCLLFSPAHAYFNVSKLVAREVDHLNKHAIMCTDGMIANLDGPGRGFGTIREIEFARSQSKPVGVVCAEELERSLLTYDLICFRSIDEALTGVLDAILTGRKMPSFGGLLLQIPGMQPPEEEPDDDAA